ncbi:ATPase [Plectosphaerella plurivora]|uniref:ATPase n=1 Tax=Plectosphaerella plurivora TaxID=936078 RepID=A0A9P8V1H1_9PEZI|nr:ATPase [Plectosphaerella plurivora]
MEQTRLKRLEHVFFTVVKGPKSIVLSRDAELFMEAARCRPSAKECLETIAANRCGLEAVRSSFRVSSSAEFISKNNIPFLSFMSVPEVKAVFEGKLLQKLVAMIVYPPTFWDAFVDMYVRKGFPGGEEDVQVFAWLCLEIVMHHDPEVIAIATGLVKTLEQHPLLAYTNPTIREYGYLIQKVMQLKATSGVQPTNLALETPGGRNDNDFANFRDISVYPTRDELASKLPPFYRRAAEVDNASPEDRPGIHLDNQFRLLREDMLAELREDLQRAFGKKGRGRNPSIYSNLCTYGLDTGDFHRTRAPSLLVSVGGGLEMLKDASASKRESILLDNKRIAPHKGFGALCKGQDVIGFAFIVRDTELLCKEVPVLGLQFPSTEILSKALVALMIPDDIRFIVVDTPVFAYEPILKRLKDILELPLQRELFRLPGEPERFEPSKFSTPFIHSAAGANGCKLQFGSSSFTLDKSQGDALAYALSSPLSVIQGPPGTGKSYIGALVAKILHRDPKSRILVLSFTNHALDQFLEDITKIGVDSKSLVRLGSKSSEVTARFSFDLLFKKSGSGQARDRSMLLAQSKHEMEHLRHEVEPFFQKVTERGITMMDILEYLEFSDDFALFWAAFQIPATDDGFETAGKHGQKMRPDHLIEKWASGQNAGWAHELLSPECRAIWSIHPEQRARHMDLWAKLVHEESLQNLQECLQRLEGAHKTVERVFTEARCDFIRTKRIIGCTTTGAAMYSNLIKAARPDYVLVEEAGEILEAHILTALHPQTKQLILIGDHKQLRPKVNNYALSVEKGDGYDLNKSLFERLILQGHPLKTLSKQHRMVPEISSLVREMTYPDLKDDDKTLTRPKIRGIVGRLVFINHDKAEVDANELKDRRDVGLTSSKSNKHEARMVLKMVKYLGQQGYKTDNIVVLTPYLGQLKLLKEILSQENDPWLNDLDNFEMIRADNYQGEESDIVIVSLTRSNNQGDIGFMKAPERLNVLLSRARNCLLMIGNMTTFMKSRQGRDLWVPFMELLKSKDALQDGLWVACEQHPEKRFLLASPKDFEAKCPDGGCTDPCRAKLSCGLHHCKRQCHRQSDHTSMKCDEILQKACEEKDHRYRVPCHERQKRCPNCLQEEEEIRRRAKRNLELEMECRARRSEYKKQLEKIQDEIAREKRIAQEEKEAEDHKKTLAMNEEELSTLRRTRARALVMKMARERQERKQAKDVLKTATTGSDPQNTKGPFSSTKNKDDNPSDSANSDWEHQKTHEHAQSKPLDMLMDMIGLEEVKLEFLRIKAAVDTAVRQGISPGNDRYSCVFLGNPGTGKTTVARIYAQFLTSMGVIPGQTFEEISGAKLASGGVPGCQKMLDKVLNDGGGVVFIDEAYQLASGNNAGGAAVLDFLLAECENLRGKCVFILAGYAKHMEAFFAHNEGFATRFPTQIKFGDYTDKELLRILGSNIENRWSNAMAVEDGHTGLFARIVAKRIGRGRGKEGFGNARAVENAFQTIYRRQAHRIQKARRAEKEEDDMLLTKEDLIGPEPSNALLKSEAWRELQKLIGLGSVKESLKAFVDTLKANYDRELKEEPIVKYSLNRVFLGNPGTGKTTIAKLYGQILVDLGMLSNGEVVVKNPSDFVAAVIGGSQKQTNSILASTVGKVLVIDEAYGLYGGNSFSSDPFKTDVIDTIVSVVQGVPGDDRCVLLLGYKDQMQDMLDNVNPGLSRRFPLASAFSFEDFTEPEMGQILTMKLEEQAYQITDEARRVAMEMLERSRNRPNFGNAGEIDILLNDAKVRHQKRFSKGKAQKEGTLEAFDIDEDFDRASRSETNVAKLFEGTIGSERIVATLIGYQETIRDLKKLDMDPKAEIPFNFLFRGPPGTGKTTTARKMAKVFYDAGFLLSTDLIDCSASDMIGQFVGQTAPKVTKLLDRAMGRVLLIDEAYRLAEGHFAKEALDELVDAVTKEKYHKKLIIILAGYEDDINRLLTVNPGLSSRFPEGIYFNNLPAEKCLELLTTLLKKRKKEIEGRRKGVVTLQYLDSPSADFQGDVVSLFEQLSEQSGWANARDVETIAKAIFRKSLKNHKTKDDVTVIHITEGSVREELTSMLGELQSRGRQAAQNPSLEKTIQLLQQQTQDAPQPPKLATLTVTDIAKDPGNEMTNSDLPAAPPVLDKDRGLCGGIRDAGVSDAVWQQLQKDAAAEAQREEEYQKKLELRETADRAMRERIIQELVEEEEKRKKEAEAKKKLKMRGLCPMGYEWIQQAGGYRCAGGSHFVSDWTVSNL